MFKDFLNGYIEAALWASCDENSVPLDNNYTEYDISSDALERMTKDCRDFYDNVLATNPTKYHDAYCKDDELAGHDFWLTRNRHGAGFWCRGLGTVGKVLTDAAHAYGECSLVVGDDGMIYLA